VKLHFTEKALRIIGKKSMAKNTGARGLRTILESVLAEAMYEVWPANDPSSKLSSFSRIAITGCFYFCFFLLAGITLQKRDPHWNSYRDTYFLNCRFLM